jgi:hypothetical protein
MAGEPRITPTVKTVISRPDRATPTGKTAAIYGWRAAIMDSPVPGTSVPAARTQTTCGRRPVPLGRARQAHQRCDAYVETTP